MKAQNGLSLLEFLVLAVVIAILVAVAGPNLATTLKGNQDNMHVNTLLASLALARHQAFKSDSNVMVCAGVASAPCTGGPWGNGWTVRYVTPPPGATTLIRAYPALGGGNTLSDSGGTRILFHPNGMTNLTAPATFTLCDRRGSNEARAVNVLVSGVARASKAPGKNLDGTSLTCPASA